MFFNGKKNVLFSAGKSLKKFPENSIALDSQELVYTDSHCHGTVVNNDTKRGRVNDFVILIHVP
jgi:hypothetical protein